VSVFRVVAEVELHKVFYLPRLYPAGAAGKAIKALLLVKRARYAQYVPVTKTNPITHRRVVAIR
jgi:hypothetical protein